MKHIVFCTEESNFTEIYIKCNFARVRNKTSGGLDVDFI